MAQIITIANQKGGVGKTTTTAALADGLTKRGYKVLQIDLDGQGNLSYTARADANGLTSLELLHGKATAKEAIQHTEAGDIIAASPNLAGSDKDLSGSGADKRLKEALEPMRSEYDFIIIDAPPSLSILTINAITAADNLIITAQADIYSLQGIGQLYSTIRAIQRTTNKGLKIAGILLTRYNGRDVLTRDLTDIAEQTAAQLKTKIFNAKIREGIAVKEAQASGQSVLTYSPRSNPARDYSDFIEELLKDLKQG